MTRSIHKYSLCTFGAVAALALQVQELPPCAAQNTLLSASKPTRKRVPMCQPQNQKAASHSADSSSPNSVARLTTANNRFGFRLFANLAEKQPNTNMCVSPTSISQALQMVYNGAAGHTSTGIALALSLQGLGLTNVNQESRALLNSLTGTPATAVKPQLAALPATPKAELAIANSLWIANPHDILPQFVKTTQTYYNAQVGPLQGAPENINAWVAQHTNNKITQIVTAADVKDAKSVLVNAVYFKGKWDTPFLPTDTVDASFHLAGGKTKSCKLMSLDSHFDYKQAATFQMVRLPYQGDRLEMVIVLPKAGTGLNTLLAKLTPEVWKTWNNSLVSAPGTVEMPRFRSEFGMKLNNSLESLGMGDAFKQGVADFSLMSHEGLFISLVMHKTFIEVNEQGTEAAAATAVTMVGKGPARPSLPPFRMRMDRPFLYAIQDHQTGAILFLGTLNTP